MNATLSLYDAAVSKLEQQVAEQLRRVNESDWSQGLKDQAIRGILIQRERQLARLQGVRQ